MEITIRAKSKSNPGEPYEVAFLMKEGRVSVLCDCPAGEWGKLCKHKTGLIANDHKLLFDSSDSELLAKAHELIQQTSLLDMYREFELRESEIKEEQANLKKELSNIKNAFGRKLNEGVE